jgi:hypothetical protein
VAWDLMSIITEEKKFLVNDENDFRKTEGVLNVSNS